MSGQLHTVHLLWLVKTFFYSGYSYLYCLLFAVYDRVGYSYENKNIIPNDTSFLAPTFPSFLSFLNEQKM
jgi:hypothetical protein